MDKKLAQYRIHKLPEDFYLRNTEIVAKDLIGKTLVVSSGHDFLAGIISETEAYLHAADFASHSANGKTARNAAMFMNGGTLYVYKIYGIHYCMNVVTEETGIGSAVLLRAVLPIEGVEIMKKNRNCADMKKLCNGPGNLTKALGMDISHDKYSLLSDNIFISDYNSVSNPEIQTTVRIGITKSADLELRFLMK